MQAQPQKRERTFAVTILAILAAIAGILSFLGRLPAPLGRRKEVLGKLAIDSREREDQLARELPVPSLGTLILRRLGLSRPEKCST